MKIYRYIAFIAAAVIIISCDDNTSSIGTILTDNKDNLEVTTDSFVVATRSIASDSVLSRSTTAYLGKVRDPETGAYITGDYMTQFHIFENYTFPDRDRMRSLIDGEIVADSCEINLFYENTSYGDSLAAMKLTMYEMATPMEESQFYYSNYNPMEKGLIRSENGIAKERAYTLKNMNLSDEERAKATTRSIRIKLNDPYTSSDGKTYNNYGSYIIDKYYQDAANYRNSYTFTHNVVPGFYFKTTNGLGSMADIYMTQIAVYFRYLHSDTVAVGTAAFSGTEEVLQTTTFINDEGSVKRLVDDHTCTYLKTPAGIFTEATLPIDEMLRGHESDTINTAKIVFRRINNSTDSPYALGPPTTLLMVPKSRMHSFFEKHEVADSKTTFIATLSTSQNSYTFNNISTLIKDLYSRRGTEDWNKVVLIPVVTTYNAQNELTKVVHDMSLKSTRLIGGSENTNGDIKISVIYSKFK